MWQVRGMDRYFWFCYQTQKQPPRNVECFCWFSHDCTLKHPSDTHRHFCFRIYYTFTKIIGVSYIEIPAEGCWIFDKKWPKMLVSTWIWTRGLPGSKKVRIFSLKLYHWAKEALYKLWAKYCVKVGKQQPLPNWYETWFEFDPKTV